METGITIVLLMLALAGIFTLLGSVYALCVAVAVKQNRSPLRGVLNASGWLWWIAVVLLWIDALRTVL